MFYLFIYLFIYLRMELFVIDNIKVYLHVYLIVNIQNKHENPNDTICCSRYRRHRSTT